VTQPVTKELLEPLVHLLVSPDLDVQKASSHALSNFALRGPGERNTQGKRRTHNCDNICQALGTRLSGGGCETVGPVPSG